MKEFQQESLFKSIGTLLIGDYYKKLADEFGDGN